MLCPARTPDRPNQRPLQGVIGVSEDALRGDCSTLPGNELDMISQKAKSMNKKIGVVSTARITHATPAGVYARTVDRDFEASVPEGCTEQVDIAQQVRGRVKINNDT